MRRPITTAFILFLATASIHTTNAQDTQQSEQPQAKAKTVIEFNKLRPDNKMPVAFYNSPEFNTFFNINQHLSQADYQEAFYDFLNPSVKEPKPVFINTGNPEQDKINYRIAKMDWLKKNSPYDYWREQENSSNAQINK